MVLIQRMYHYELEGGLVVGHCLVAQGADRSLGFDIHTDLGSRDLNGLLPLTPSFTTHIFTQK